MCNFASEGRPQDKRSKESRQQTAPASLSQRLRAPERYAMSINILHNLLHATCCAIHIRGEKIAPKPSSARVEGVSLAGTGDRINSYTKRRYTKISLESREITARAQYGARSILSEHRNFNTVRVSRYRSVGLRPSKINTGLPTGQNN